jgi:hypothetical protein
MIESRCEHCGAKTFLPDPEPNTQEENIEFRKAWDERYVVSQSAKRA